MNEFYKQTKPMGKSIFKNLIIAFFCILLVSSSYAQAPTISYPSPAQSLIRGYSDSLLTIKLVFNGVCSGTVRLGLPASITYVPGTVSKTSGTASVTIAESSISDLSKPTFSISGVATIGDEITFTVARRAACGTLTTAKDSVYFIAGLGCSNASETVGAINTYNIQAPSLSITPAAALTGVVIGTTTSRTTTITNGGFGKTDTVRFYIVYPSGGIVNTSGTNTITANAINFTPSSTSGDTLFYQIYGLGLGSDKLLTNGETITITEPIKIVKCNTTTTYGTGWGRNTTTVCTWTTATSSMTMAIGVPDYTSASFGLLAYTDNACSPHDTKFTVTNIGTGSTKAATMYNVVITEKSNDMSATSRYTLSNYRIGTTVITPTFTGGLTNQTMTIDLAALALTADPDGAGVGLEDIDGDGYYDDLPPGNTLTYTLQFKINDFRTAYCDPLNSSQMYWRWITNVGYSTMCSNTITYPKADVNGSLIATAIDGLYLSMNNFSPITIQGGIPFTLDSKITNFSPGLGDLFALWPTNSAKRRWVHRFTMPSGVSLSGGTGNPKVNGIATTASTSGSVVTINVDGQTQPGEVTLDFVFTCGSDGIVTIPYTLEFIDDRTVPCNIDNELYCYNFSMNVIGCSPCLTGGPIVSIPNVRRDDNSYGYTSGALTTRVAYTAIPANEQKQALYYDTVRIEGKMIQTAAAANLFYRLQLDKTSTLHQDKFLPLNAQVTIMRAGAVLSTCTRTISDVSTVDATSTTSSFEWNLTSCLPTGGLLANDSVFVIAKYQVSSKDLPTNSFVQAPGTKYTFYNKDVLGNKLICYEFPIDLYLAVYNISNSLEQSNAPLVACNEVILGRYINYSTLGGNFPYAHEIRPISRYQSINIKVPESVTITRAVPAGSLVPGTGSYTYYPSIAPNTTVNNGDGTKTITFNNNGTFPINNGQGYALLDVYGIPSCKTLSGAAYTFNSKLRRTYYGETVPYGTADITPSIDLWNNDFANSKVFQNEPAITVQNNTGTVQGVVSQHYWDIQINSVGTSTAPYVWFALERTSGSNITIDSVVLKPSNVVIPATSTYNTADKWYQLSATGLASGTSQQARVYFKYSNCVADSLRLKGGWNCAGYPSPDPQADINACAFTSYLKVDPQPSQVQLSILRQPGGGSTINLCTPDSALLVLNSAQAANLINPYLVFYPPTGVTLASTIKVEYPLGSGNYQNAAITSLGGGGYKIDLTAHTLIGSNGVLGTASSSPSFVPLGGDRQVKIKLDFTTDCSYASGTSFVVYAYGNKPCGAAAIDNGIASTTSPLNITGASAPGGAGVTISFGGAPSSISCGSPVIAISLVTTPTTLGTSVGDTMIYTLPSGLGYAGGLTSGFTADTSGSGGVTIVKIALPLGVPASTAINYTFNVVPEGGGCGPVNIMGAYKRLIPSLMCGATSCASSSVVISSATSPNITLNKPSLSITNLKVLDTNMWIMGWAWINRVKIFYNNNNSYQAYTGSQDSVEFFCGSSTTPFAVRPLTKSLAIGANDSDYYEIIIPTTACTAGTIVTAKIQTKTAAGTLQCLCNPSSFQLLGVPLPLKFLSTNSNVQDCAVHIGWTYNESSNDDLQSFEIERSNNGIQYSTVASLNASETNYIDVTPNSGKWYYRIKAVGADGTKVYSNTLMSTTTQCLGSSVQIYPNPTSQLLNIVMQGSSSNNQYEIVDALGRVVSKGLLQNNTNNKVDVNMLAQGIYVLKVITDESVNTQQVYITR